ncbi:hypothetical protein PIROE2DRAFT_12276 [Piromyces sp. E2]|nr:hypothetical protein PIROE2DRAFT_12276 [Piromyces sp. E2]|eukprot:OUM61681.1 hypothetical protein PIROE2DRAFT_12276 [Piromyces sp. E2]
MLNIKNLMFFKLEMNDTYNTEIKGQTEDYCFETKCELPNFKSQFWQFENNEYHIPIKIKECNSSKYIYQYKESNNFKSCYTPYCEPSCKNNGLCINDNICNCKDTKKTGKFCSDNYKMERVKVYDIIIMIITSLLIINSIGFIIKVYIYQNDQIIKGALIIIFEVADGHKTVTVLIEKENIYEYIDCQRSSLTILSNILNFAIMAIGYYLTYSTRNLQNQFKESLLIIIDEMNLSLTVKDYFNTIGPLLYSISTIFDIFYHKFKIIKERIKVENNMMKVIENRKEYEYQRRFDNYSKVF